VPTEKARLGSLDEDSGEGPLSGIRVLDFTRQMAGPYGSLMLGDYGADVIKVESMPRGDGSRRTGTTFVGGESTMFLTWNRNKRSLCIDLRDAEGIEVIRRLLGQTDVLMENYRPGVAEEIGIGYEEMNKVNPQLIYCSTSAFGDRGPWHGRPGTDPVVQAMSGVMSVTGERGGGPALVGIPIADYTGSMVTFQSVLLGLLARQKTGRGQHIRTSMFGALLFGLTTRLGPFFATGDDPERWGSQHSQVVPYQAFETSDGWAVAGVWGDDGWGAFCQALDMSELANDPRYDSNPKRVDQRDELSALLARRFAELPTAEWEKRFADGGVLFAPVNGFDDILNHEQTRAMGYVVDVQHPTAGDLKQIAPVIEMPATPATIRRPPPLLGQHSREILVEAGLSEEEMNRLVNAGVVKDNQFPSTAS
jgi:crotonobetainyl-CoA:carnitine CoA-transferase CaiB-like acyl-CoA transferase